MQPLPISHAPGGWESKPMQTVQTVQPIRPAEVSVRSRMRRVVRLQPSSSQLVVNISGSTESVVVYSFVATGEVSGSANFLIEQPARTQILLERDFARLVGFGLEPEQPTDEDVRRRSVYKFPTR